MAARGGRGGARGGRGGGGAGRGGKMMIAGTEVEWDLSGLEIQKGPAERYPKYHHPPQPNPATEDEKRILQHHLGIRTRIREGPFYTILNDGMKNGLKRKSDDRVPTEAALFNAFSENQTYSARYIKKRRRVPKLDTRPYVVDLFPPELHELLVPGGSSEKRQLLSVTRMNAKSYVDRMIQQEQDRLKDVEDRAENEEEEANEEEDADENEGKPDAVDEEDNWSAVSSDSEESGDDYNAEQYFDNGDDDEVDDGDYGDGYD
ncbi:hypothetical protein P280DRAFT_444287 [Massarina eburnea CBS 473.64]|uniref:DNA-directed RNA polymerase III subunit n=1 Tax=Massarina eburnea CBS 473.64 TaxID=1395130 RepID=A0A6A6SF29_9PLEO|nr:hypothetical protein P280DRAFT_444287 [Massarina eburnea CBS 473.64]